MNLKYPDQWELWAWLLPLALLHLGLWIQQWAWQRRQFDARLLKRFGPALSLPRLLLKWALWSAAGFCLLYALAVPLGPATRVANDDSGADIVLAVDVSSSMHAQDIKPDRLAALKQALLIFLDRLNGDRVGLVAFAGESIIACPLTSDTETLSLFLSKLDTDSVPSDGTGLGPALKMALDGFEVDPKRGRLIMLATDGEDTQDSDVMDQAQRAAKAGIPIFTLGIGTAEGALIPGQRDLFGNVYAKTYRGQPVRTHLDSSGLKKIAAITGGQYFEGASASGLAKAYERVRQLKQGLAKGQEQYTREPLYQEPLLWAFWLLLVESLLSARGFGWLKLWQRAGRILEGGVKSSAGARTLLLLLVLLPSVGSAWSWGGDGRSDYNLGNQRFRQGDMGGAAQSYAKSLDANPDQPDATYNLGLALERMDDPESATEAYQEALKKAPNDTQIQNAYQRALKKAAALPKSKAQGGGSGDGSAGSSLGFRDKVKSWAQGQGLAQQPSTGAGSGSKSGASNQAVGRNPRTAAPDATRMGRGGGPRQEMEEQAGRGHGTPGSGSGPGGSGGGSGRAAAAAQGLNQDQVQAMMNQLAIDQQRYAGAFNPTQKFDQSKPQDNADLDAIMKMMGAPDRIKAKAGSGGAERKDW